MFKFVYKNIIKTFFEITNTRNQRQIDPDSRCFLATWAVSKSVFAVKHDRSKLKLPKSKGIYSSSSSSFEGYPLQARQKQDWGRGFILLLAQDAVPPGSDAGSDIVKPASSFVIQNRQTSYSMWCPMYRARC